MSQRSAALRRDDVSREIAALLYSGSLELGAQRPDDISGLAEILPQGTPVYVPHLPRHDLAKAVQCCVALRAAGLEPVPHIAVRRMTSVAEAGDFVSKLASLGGVRRALVIGSDLAPPAGCFHDVVDLVRSGILSQAGLEHLDFGAYPEGHPQIGQCALWKSLEDKVASAREFGLSAGIVTQFSFSASAIADYAIELHRRFPGIPVRLGIAGPANPLTLMKFAQACGVVASFKAASGLGFAAARLALNGNPSPLAGQIASLLQATSRHSVEGLHLFSFGGTRATAEWMKSNAGR